jgi:putative transcriptional regulator
VTDPSPAGPGEDGEGSSAAEGGGNRPNAPSDENAAMDSLRGHLLVAGPALIDPNFRRTVVLVGEHGEEGAMGVVLNRPSGIEVDEAVPPLGELDGVDGVVYVGGPVQPQAIVVLGDFAEPEQAGVLVFGSIGFLPSEIEPTEMGELARARVFAGYAGWGAGQLEEELEERSWIVEPAAPADVFTDTPEQLWSHVLRRKGGPFSLLALMPDDPRVN